MSFEYNDEGIRTSKTVNGVETTYYVNGGQIVAESNNSRTKLYKKSQTQKKRRGEILAFSFNFSIYYLL